MRADPDVRRWPLRWLGRLRHPRRTARRVADRVWRHAPSLLLACAAAGIAYVLAGLVFTTEHALFAPIAAVVSMGLTAGQRLTRAVEISLGVVLGLLAADLISRVIGVGAWQLTLAVLVAMTVAVAFRTSGLLVNQAAVAAVVVMALVPFQDVGPFVRLGDAVIGGAVAVALNAFFSPDPGRSALATAEQVLARHVRALRRLVKALETGSLSTAEATLDDLAELEGARKELEDVLAATRERIRLARAAERMEQRRRLGAVEQLAARMDLMLTSARSIARATASVVRHGLEPDPYLARGVSELADAVEELSRWLRGKTDTETARDRALSAAITASRALGDQHAPATSVLAWQIRSTVVDLLRILGLSHHSAVAALEAAAGRADRLDPD